AANGQMDVGRGFLDQTTECQAWDNLRGRRNRHSNQVRLVADNGMKKALTEELDVGILTFIPDDLHQVFGRINGAVSELIVHNCQTGGEIECGEYIQPFINEKETFFIGFEIVEARPAKGLLGRLNTIYEIRKPVQRLDNSRQMLS